MKGVYLENVILDGKTKLMLTNLQSRSVQSWTFLTVMESA
jgi:hypothetical protein